MKNEKPYTPFTYHLCWSKLNIHYYGAKYSKKDAHPDVLWNPYKTSSKHVKAFIEIYGEPDIIEVRRTFCTATEATAWEHRVLKRLDALHKDNWLNMSNGWCEGKYFHGWGSKEKHPCYGRNRPEDEKKRISDSNKGKVRSKETCAKIRESKKGTIHSVESNLKRSQTQRGMVACRDREGNHYYITVEEFRASGNLIGLSFGIPHSEEHSRNISKSLIGYIPCKDKEGNRYRLKREEYEARTDLMPLTLGNSFYHTPEAKVKISNGLMGKKKSKQHCQNISKSKRGCNNPSFGRLPWNTKIVQVFENGQEIIAPLKSFLGSGFSEEGIRLCCDTGRLYKGYFWRRLHQKSDNL